MTRSGDLRVFSPEEVWSLVRAAATEADGALFLTAAFTGLRTGGCSRCAGATWTLPAARSAVSYYAGHLTTPKSGKVRAVPLAPDVASALAQLGQRLNWVGSGRSPARARASL